MLPLLLVLVILLLLVETPWVQSRMKRLVEEQSKTIAVTVADFTLDALNAMMMTGKDWHKQRNIFIAKLNSWEQVREIRVFRSPLNEDQYPARGDHDRPQDVLDLSAIASGTAVMKMIEDPNGNYFRAVIPFKSTKNRSGTHCGECHAAPEGSVLGAISIKLNLEKTEQLISTFNARFASFKVVILLIVVAFLYFSLRKLIIKPIGQTVARMRDIVEGEGDLTKRLKISGNDEIAELASTFNMFIDHIHAMIADINDVSAKMASASSELTVSSEQIATGAKTQTDQMDSVAHIMHDMTITSDAIAKSAEQAATMSNDALNDALKGSDEVGKSIGEIKLIEKAVRGSAESLDTLGTSSKHIDEIVNVIDYIADQTNLLALNASIEAARAGEQGKGFSVVADEVRKLSERTTKATKEISQVIVNIQRESKNAVKAMNQCLAETHKGVDMSAKAGDAFNHILDAVGKINDQINHIASAVEEQSASTKSIAGNISSIETISKETATGSGESAISARDLNKVAITLDNLVKKFKINT